MTLIEETVIYLAAAVVIVPLLRRTGFGAVLGYLAAGLLLGRFGLGLVKDPAAILHFAEIGVVLLLFVIGLELQPSRLRAFRRLVFGLGFAQVAVTGAVLYGIAIALGLDWRAAALIGLALPLSSTAMVLQLLSERREMLSQKGRAAFGTLLFQDIAVIPILAILPVLAPASGDAGGAAVLSRIGVAVVGVAAFLVIGRFALRPILRLVAAADTQEVFTALALMLVLGSGLLMEEVGLSMGLGAFLAGVLVADSEYRHQLEADILPFKGLLLGLFFMAVGMTADLSVIVDQPLVVLGLTLGLYAVKGTLVFGLSLAVGEGRQGARDLGVLMGQGGEFAFVIFAAGASAGLVEQALVDLMVVAVTLSMIATPFALMINDRVARDDRGDEAAREYDVVPEAEPAVIIAGFGRFGQVVGRLLAAQKIPFTALESSPSAVDFVRRFGSEVYYGDPRRLDLLRAAHAQHARVLVLAVDDPETSVEIAEIVGQSFPHLAIYARARNRAHALRLMELGARVVRRETFLSSLDLGIEVMCALGANRGTARRAAELFREHDENTLEQQRAIHDDEQALMASAREAAGELQYLFETDDELRRRHLEADLS